MIANENNYLLLKQMLVVVQALRRNAEVSFGLNSISENSATAVISKTITDIQNDFTPYDPMVMNKGIFYDFSIIQDCLKSTTGDMNPTSEHGEYILSINSNPDKLQSAIYQYPLMDEQYEMCQFNLKDNNVFSFQNTDGSELFKCIYHAFDFIKNWLNKEVHSTPAQLIILVNLIELTERMFVHIQDCYGEDNGPST